jgi:hypothetical protein
MSASLRRWVLPAIITVLALADGVLHFSLDFVLFRGNVFGPPGGGRPAGAAGLAAGASGGPGPPPGAPAAPLPLPLNELFLLNLIGFVVLVLVYWLGPRWVGWLRGRRWLVELALLVYVAATFVGWLAYRRPNPRGLGYLARGLELVLVIALLADIWIARGERGVKGRAA